MFAPWITTSKTYSILFDKMYTYYYYSYLLVVLFMIVIHLLQILFLYVFITNNNFTNWLTIVIISWLTTLSIWFLIFSSIEKISFQCFILSLYYQQLSRYIEWKSFSGNEKDIFRHFSRLQSKHPSIPLWIYNYYKDGIYLMQNMHSEIELA